MISTLVADNCQIHSSLDSRLRNKIVVTLQAPTFDEHLTFGRTIISNTIYETKEGDVIVYHPRFRVICYLPILGVIDIRPE